MRVCTRTDSRSGGSLHHAPAPYVHSPIKQPHMVQKHVGPLLGECGSPAGSRARVHGLVSQRVVIRKVTRPSGRGAAETPRGADGFPRGADEFRTRTWRKSARI
eukprot:3377613-Pleurochrysis_carterae.AAC.1